MRGGSALPDDAFRVEWISAEPISRLAPGKTATIAVSLRNRSATTWPDPQAGQPADPTGVFAIRLAWRWLDPRNHRVLVDFGSRSDLPWPLRPGSKALLRCEVHTPPVAGDYELEFQLVQEGVAWFSSKGGDGMVVPVAISPP